MASKQIHDWLDELSDWPWPKQSTYAGYEMPPAKMRRLSEPREPYQNHNFSQEQHAIPEPETPYLGSLKASQIARYEIRIEQVTNGMDELDLEEIKSHVLLNHIMPLSRSGTPYSDIGASSISFNRMEDITAVITAITVQALPNLSRLSRLLRTWSIRIVVLRQVPTALVAMTDAEIALKSGWNAIRLRQSREDGSPGMSSTLSLPRKDFEVMSSVLRRKIEQPGRDLDYMLDLLEGMADTLPDDWLDRMDAIESDYHEWAAAAERRVRAGETGREVQSPLHSKARQSAPGTPQPKIRIQIPSPTRDGLDESPGRYGESSILEKSPMDHVPIVNKMLDSRKESVDEIDVNAEIPIENLRQDYSVGMDGSPIAAANEGKDTVQKKQRRARDLDGSSDRPRNGRLSTALSELDRNSLRIAPPEVLAPSPNLFRKSIPDLQAEYSFLESVNEDDEYEPQLPPARFIPRRMSQDSMASTVLHDPASDYDYSDDGYHRERSTEPELPRLPDPNQPFSSDAPSPPSSPPLRPRTTSVSFNDVPEMSRSPDEPATSPLEPPEVFDPESSFDYRTHMSSPSRASVVSESGDELHQQIREVLRNLPNKIRLSTKPSAINLNPPDIQLPRLSRIKSTDSFRRSGSALSTRSTMSSRASTPSWLLAPARVARPQSRASHEAKTYYLSRSDGEAPMKLLVRCVGENGERVMVRVGGGWADLGEYLKEYAIHHSRRSKGEGKVEVKDSSMLQSSRMSSSPPSRPGSAFDAPMSPLVVRKTRKTSGGEGSSRLPATPSGQGRELGTPSSDGSVGSRATRALSHPNSSILGMAGPHPKKTKALDEEGRQWVEDMRNKVRTASGEQRTAVEQSQHDSKFGELGKVGGTKRVFRKSLA